MENLRRNYEEAWIKYVLDEMMKKQETCLKAADMEKLRS